ncbi:hypothetical protein F5146DRAFT_1227749 [Armillaria mellea]|nr:hypothetical protein F5146DRAFT_1227749 [Armillaria mellea]
MSSISFAAVILIMACIVIWWCWLFSGRRWMFVVIPGLCIIIGTIFAGFGLYQMAITTPLGNGCAAQIDWMLPYFSMVLSVALSCMLVTLYHIVISSRIGERTLRLWIKIVIESSLLFAAAPVAYILSDVRTTCPLLGVTMIASLAPILAIAQVPDNIMRPMLWTTHFELHRVGTLGSNAGSVPGENREDSAV